MTTDRSEGTITGAHLSRVIFRYMKEKSMKNDEGKEEKKMREEDRDICMRLCSLHCSIYPGHILIKLGFTSAD